MVDKTDLAYRFRLLIEHKERHDLVGRIVIVPTPAVSVVESLVSDRVLPIGAVERYEKVAGHINRAGYRL